MKKNQYISLAQAILSFTMIFLLMFTAVKYNQNNIDGYDIIFGKGIDFDVSFSGIVLFILIIIITVVNIFKIFLKGENLRITNIGVALGSLLAFFLFLLFNTNVMINGNGFKWSLLPGEKGLGIGAILGIIFSLTILALSVIEILSDYLKDDSNVEKPLD